MFPRIGARRLGSSLGATDATKRHASTQGGNQRPAGLIRGEVANRLIASECSTISTRSVTPRRAMSVTLGPMTSLARTPVAQAADNKVWCFRFVAAGSGHATSSLPNTTDAVCGTHAGWLADIAARCRGVSRYHFRSLWGPLVGRKPKFNLICHGLRACRSFPSRPAICSH